MTAREPSEAVKCTRCGDVFEFADQAECCEDFDCPLVLSAAINNSRAAYAVDANNPENGREG